MRLRSLSRLVLALAATSVVVAGGIALAGNSTLSYTAGQSTAIQTQLIPKYNAEHCTRFGQAVSCSTAELVSAGCTVQTFKTIVQDSCVIFTQDVTGEAAFLKEVANIGLITVNNRLIASDVANYQAAECSRFKSLSVANQNTECTLRGLATGCAGPCP